MFGAIRDYLFGSDKSSKSLAKSRLHFVLVQDRTGLSTEDLAGFKREMVDVLEKYFVIDKNGFDISYKRESDLTMLVINSPVVVRRQDAVGVEVGAKTKASRGKYKKNQNANQKQQANSNSPVVNSEVSEVVVKPAAQE